MALDDLVRHLVAALDEPRTVGRAFDVGSVEAPTDGAPLGRTAELLGHPEPRVAVTPLWLLRAGAPSSSGVSGCRAGACGPRRRTSAPTWWATRSRSVRSCPST